MFRGLEHYKEHYLFRNELTERTTDEEIFLVTYDFFKTYDIPWSNCTNIYANDAAVVMGSKKGFHSSVKGQNLNTEITHSCIHRKIQIIKNFPIKLL